MTLRVEFSQIQQNRIGIWIIHSSSIQGDQESIHYQVYVVVRYCFIINSIFFSQPFLSSKHCFCQYRPSGTCWCHHNRRRSLWMVRKRGWPVRLNHEVQIFEAQRVENQKLGWQLADLTETNKELALSVVNHQTGIDLTIPPPAESDHTSTPPTSRTKDVRKLRMIRESFPSFSFPSIEFGSCKFKIVSSHPPPFPFSTASHQKQA